MKRVFAVLTVIALVAMLLAGCTTYGAPSSTPEQKITSPSMSPEQTSPSPAQTAGSTTLSPITGTSTGTIKVLITDAPKYNVSSVNLTVEKVEVHRAGSGGASGNWTELDITNEKQPFDLLHYQNGLTMFLAGKEVPTGNYTQLRMTVFKVLVSYDGVVNQEAEVPSHELKFVRPFTLEGGETIKLIVDIDAAKSVVITGSAKEGVNKVLFKPVVKLQVVHEEESSHQGPTATFSTNTGPVGSVIEVTGTGWAENEYITSVKVGNMAADNILEVDSSGNLEGDITIPTGLATRTHGIVIKGENSGPQTFPNTFTVTE